MHDKYRVYLRSLPDSKNKIFVDFAYFMDYMRWFAHLYHGDNILENVFKINVDLNNKVNVTSPKLQGDHFEIKICVKSSDILSNRLNLIHLCAIILLRLIAAIWNFVRHRLISKCKNINDSWSPCSIIVQKLLFSIRKECVLSDGLLMIDNV